MKPLDLLESLIAAERRVVPTSSYKVKDESLLMRSIGVAVWPFNKGFMSQYTTTIGTTSYFPKTVLESPEVAAETEAHEFVHKWDYLQHKSKFTFGYVFNRKYRRDAEIRGYTMSMFYRWLRWGQVSNPQDYVRFFTGPDYLYMEKDEGWVKRVLDANQRMFIEDEEAFLNQPNATPYVIIRDFLRSRH